jgi:hypothetical protein
MVTRVEAYGGLFVVRILPDGVAFTGEGKLVRKATRYEAEASRSGNGFAELPGAIRTHQ